MGLFEFAKAVLGPQPGVTLFLLVCLVLALVAYNREKVKNDVVADARLKEAREDTELLVETVNEAVTTVKEFKASNEALRVAFEALASAVKEGRATTPGKSARGG
jgi:hypothetical protein